MPLVIVVGAALSDTTYLTFPPQGLSLRWFQNIFEISAFRRTIVTSLQIALLGTLIALLIGIPAAYALNRFRIELPKWLGNAVRAADPRARDRVRLRPAEVADGRDRRADLPRLFSSAIR